MREEEPEHSISDIGVGPTGGTSAHHMDFPAPNDICEEVSLHSTVFQRHSGAIDMAEAKTECIDTELVGIGGQRGLSDPFALGVAGPWNEVLQCPLSVFTHEIRTFDRSVDLRRRTQNAGRASRVDEYLARGTQCCNVPSASSPIRSVPLTDP